MWSIPPCLPGLRSGLTVYETLIKFAVINAIWIPIHILWNGAGVSLRRLELSRTKQRAVNYAMAVALMSVVILALTA